jgi:hypothetical protein
MQGTLNIGTRHETTDGRLQTAGRRRVPDEQRAMAFTSFVVFSDGPSAEGNCCVLREETRAR